MMLASLMLLAAPLPMVRTNVAPPKSEETFVYAREEPWEIRVDTTVDGGCFVIAGYPDGTSIRLGFDRRNDNAMLLIGNSNWKSLEAGKNYALDLKFDDDSPWEAKADAFMLDPTLATPFLRVTFTEEKFILDFATKLSLAVIWNKKQIGKYRLNGSAKAIDKMLECQEKMETTRDPFKVEGAPSAGADPFKT